MELVQRGCGLRLPSRLVYPVGRGGRTGVAWWSVAVQEEPWHLSSVDGGHPQKSQASATLSCLRLQPSARTDRTVAPRSQANGERQWARHRRQERWTAVDDTAQCNMMQLSLAASHCLLWLCGVVATLHSKSFSLLCSWRYGFFTVPAAAIVSFLQPFIYSEAGKGIFWNWCYFSGESATVSQVTVSTALQIKVKTTVSLHVKSVSRSWQFCAI